MTPFREHLVFQLSTAQAVVTGTAAAMSSIHREGKPISERTWEDLHRALEGHYAAQTALLEHDAAVAAQDRAP